MKWMSTLKNFMKLKNQKMIKRKLVINMLTINWKQIYEFNLNDKKQWILILYDISQNHYVGVPVYNEEKENSVYIKSINKYF